MLRRLRLLDWILVVVGIGAVVVVAYRYQTQGYFDWTDLGYMALSILGFIRYRSPMDKPNPSLVEWAEEIGLVVMGGSVGLGLIWTFAFSDTKAEALHSGMISLLGVGIGASILVFVRTKFSIQKRKTGSTTRDGGP